MKNIESIPAPSSNSTTFELIEDMDSQETYTIIKPELSAEYASKALKRMAEINRIESAA